MPIIIFLIGIIAGTAPPLSIRRQPWTISLSGGCASDKLTAATLPGGRPRCGRALTWYEAFPTGGQGEQKGRTRARPFKGLISKYCLLNPLK